MAGNTMEGDNSDQKKEHIDKATAALNGNDGIVLTKWMRLQLTTAKFELEQAGTSQKITKYTTEIDKLLGMCGK